VAALVESLKLRAQDDPTLSTEEMPKISGLEQIKRISGTSAGAICACLLAIGYNAMELEAILRDMDFVQFVEGLDVEKLQREDSWLGRMIALAEEMEVNVSYRHPFQTLTQLFGRDGLCSGNAFLEWLTECLDKKLQEDLERFSEVKEIEANQRVVEILMEKQNKGQRLGHLTFGELKALVEAAPRHYKHLHVIASRLANEEKGVTAKIETFESDSGAWSDVLVIDGVRASMSFPGVFSPYRVRRFDPDNPRRLVVVDADKQYVDGGMIKNYPVEAFDRLGYLLDYSPGDADKALINPHTLGFRLVPEVIDEKQDNGAGQAASSSQPQTVWTRLSERAKALGTKIKDMVDVSGHIKASISDEVKHLIQTEAVQLALDIVSYYMEAETLLADYQNTRTGRTIDIKNAGIPILKFNLTPEEMDRLVERGYSAVADYFEVTI
jgi:predicted acylesterase/phospholipase RssA